MVWHTADFIQDALFRSDNATDIGPVADITAGSASIVTIGVFSHHALDVLTHLILNIRMTDHVQRATLL